jgi:hypothetical protein
MTFDNHALIASELQKVLNRKQNSNMLECSQTFVSINQHICFQKYKWAMGGKKDDETVQQLFVKITKIYRFNN